MALNTYSLAVAYNVGGQFAANILHYQFDDAGFASTASAARDLCTNFQTANQTALKNILSTHVSILSYRARALTQPGGFEGQVLVTPAAAGLRTGNLMVAGVGPVYIWIPTGNVKQRGRMFVPGVSDTDCVDGVLTAAYVTVLATNGATLITPFTLTGGGAPVATPVVFSRKPVKQSRTIAHVLISMNLGQIRRRQVPV